VWLRQDGPTSRSAKPGGVMLKFLLGAAVGYVLGAKAGHERYEQLKRTYQRVSDHPAVQGAAGVVRARVEEKVNGGKHTADSTANGHGR
jgi:hypothetical protein